MCVHKPILAMNQQESLALDNVFRSIINVHDDIEFGFHSLSFSLSHSLSLCRSGSLCRFTFIMYVYKHAHNFMYTPKFGNTYQRAYADIEWMNESTDNDDDDDEKKKMNPKIKWERQRKETVGQSVLDLKRCRSES